MKHPLSSFGYYSGSADFNRSGIDKVDADFSAGNVVNASEDFGKQCMSGDFGVDYGEDHYQGGFEGYGHMDHFLGDYDEGMGRRFKIKKPKIKISAPKAIAKPIAQITKPVVAQVQKITQVAQAVPGVAQVQALAQKATEAVSKVGIPIQAIAPVLAPLLPPKATVQAQPVSEEVVQDIQEQLVSPERSFSTVVSAQQAHTPLPQVKVNGNLAHPLLFSHRKLKGELMSGWLDDLYKKQKSVVQSLIDKNKAKVTAAATTQASNIIGKQLDKLTKSDPRATAAIQSVVATATETATAKAKQGLTDTLKASFDQNKKYIFAVGGGLLALVALKMFMKRKA